MNVVDLPYLRPRRKDIFIHLPLEIQERILKNLRPQDVIACCQVSKTWNKIISSRKLIWKNFCRTSSFNYKMVENEANTRCKEWFLFMKRRVAKAKVDGPKIYVLRPTDSQGKSETVEIRTLHVHESFIAIATVKNSIEVYKFSESESAVRILEINETRYYKNIIRLRVDGIIVAAMFPVGSVSAWNIKYGHRIATHNSLRHHFCFDLWKNTLNVAFGGRGYIAVTNLRSHKTFEVKTNENELVDHIVANIEYSGNHDLESKTFWLFCSDCKNVFVFKITVSLISYPEVGSVTLLHAISLPRLSTKDWLYSPDLSMCYDGSKYLYYFRQSFENDFIQTITKLDIATGQVMETLTLPKSVKVDKLLGAGKEILLFISNDIFPDDILLYAATSSLKKFCVIFRIASNSPDEVYVFFNEDTYICETNWLNGLDESNDHGLICGYLINNNAVHLAYNPQKLK